MWANRVGRGHSPDILFTFISGASLLLSFLASLYPAKKAAKVNPINAIKWE